jgi:hypothetical protein
MNYLPEWGDHTALLSIAIIFLIASIAGWYAGNLFQSFRR